MDQKQQEKGQWVENRTSGVTTFKKRKAEKIIAGTKQEDWERNKGKGIKSLLEISYDIWKIPFFI